MFKEDQCILVIVDVQGKLAGLMSGAEQVVEKISQLIRGFKVLGLPMIYLEQMPEKLGSTVDGLSVLLANETAISKTTFSCMGTDVFNAALTKTGRKQVILVGIEAHICVYQSARDLLNEGYEVAVLEDAVSSRTEVNKRIGIEKMAKLGAEIYSVEMLLFEILADASHSKFRDIARVIK